jgi:hypothetical protein
MLLRAQSGLAPTRAAPARGCEMTFWIVAGAVCIVLFAIAWWTSGRSKGTVVDPRRAFLKSEAYARSQETQTVFRPDPRGPSING